MPSVLDERDLAIVAALQEDARATYEAERAGRLWGAIEDSEADAPFGGWRRHREASAARILACAGPEFQRGLAAGRELSLDDAVEVALGSVD